MPPPFELLPFPGGRALAAAAAADWLALARESPASHTTALSGGRIAKCFFAAVVELAPKSGAAMGQVDFFWADERCVPPDHPESNFLLAQENLLRPLGIVAQRIHRLKGEWPPAAAVAAANDEIRRVAARDEAGLPMLDLVFLGMGEDGHVASLMPNAPPEVSHSREPYVHVPNSPKPPPNRLSLTYPVLAAAKNVWVLAAGAAKRQALRESLRLNGITPFARMLQSRSHTRIYTDLNEIAAEQSKQTDREGAVR
jgi:6-phosphogluconolactonase